MSDAEALDKKIAALERELARYQFAEHAARSGHWRMTLPDRIITWSPGMFRLADAPPSDVAPSVEWMRQRVHADDQVHMDAVLDQAAVDGKPFAYRFRAIGPGGAMRWYDLRGDTERDATGKTIALIGVGHDITDVVEAEAAHAHALDLFRLMAEEASDVISLHPIDGSAQFVSNSFERMHGLKAENMDMRTLFERVHPEDVQEASRLKARPGPGEVISATYRTRHADGHYFWIETSARSIYDETTGQPRYVVAVSRNVDERVKAGLALKAAQARAEEANRAKSDFLANMSHELRTPLNAIIGFADFMRSQALGPINNPRYVEYVELIHSSGQLLLDLITDILDMAKIDAGKLEFHFETVDLRQSIAECLRLVEGRAQVNRVRLKCNLADGDLKLTADHRAIKQILLNLLSNAVKFTPQGQVTVEVERTAEGLCLAVRDNGIGIPAEHLPRLGRRFEQVTTDPMIAKGGTGLGLALVFAFAERHGGKVEIESTEGTGTTVTVTLPLVPPDIAQHAA